MVKIAQSRLTARSHAGWPATLSAWMAGAVLALAGTTASAQSDVRGPTHYPHSGRMPPGVVGRDMLTSSAALRGYFQPVEIQTPRGASISLVVDGQFEKPQPAPIRAGMLIGQVYRFKVTNIPENEGAEVYPTIEVINRMYPPPGEAPAFPIPIQLTEEELAMALDGLLVTRVIYLENPDTALPRREVAGFQRYFEVGVNQDPLRVADDLGRPMAILRMGSRVPDQQQLSREFAYGSPPLLKLAVPPPVEEVPADEQPQPAPDEAASRTADPTDETASEKTRFPGQLFDYPVRN